MPIISPMSDVKNLILALTVKLNDAPIKDVYAIVSVNVHHEIYKISYAELTLAGDTVEGSTHPMADSDDFAPGNKIEILAGIGSNNEVSIFKGIIVKQGVEISPSSTFNVLLTCKHEAVKMTMNRTEAEFAGKTDSAIIASIGSNYSGLTISADATTPVQENIFQKLATDWDFILSRAEFYGFIVTQDGTDLYIGKPKLSASPVLRVAMGESIMAFSAELNAEKQMPGISVNAWDMKTQALITASAEEPSLNSHGNVSAKKLSGMLGQKKLNLSSSAPMAQEELKAWADGALLRSRLSGIKGQVTYFGNGIVKTGDIIQLEGVGEHFSGDAFVSAVQHTLEQGKWKTKVKFGLDARYIAEKPNFSQTPAAGLLPAIHGLHIGTVKKIFEDPESQFRILVDLPSTAETQTGFWARMSNFYATGDAGSFFIPEPGDEVIVGFIENDPRYPVILGSLYSSGKKAPQAAADNNNYIKSITTKSKMKISFDEENKIIKIETPGGNVVTMDDKNKVIELTDMNGNDIKMSSSGIDITTSKDLNVSAANINLDAKQNIAVTAKSEAKMEGANVTLNAKMALAAKGTATAEFSASGQTTIKGAMVMIN